MRIQHAYIAACLLVVGITAPAFGQEIDDLFAEPYGTSADQQEAVPGSLRSTNRRVDVPPRSPSDRRLIPGNSTSGLDASYEMAMNLRQARALEASRQRMARMEAANWAGDFPSRPNWNPMPTMSTRYPTHNVVFVPAYYYGR